jgi:tetratricopeptide (TPR) repeat protein
MDDSMQAAEAALAEQRYEDAHGLCMEALVRDPKNATAMFLLGVIAAAHDNHRKAVNVFDRALSLDATIPRIHAHRARCLIVLNRPSAAVAAADRAEQLTPEDSLTLDTIGVVYSRTGFHERAIPLFERAAQQDPSNASYAYNLASSQQFQGDFEAAEQNYRRAIALDPDHYRAYSSMVQLYRATEHRNDLDALNAGFERLGSNPEAALNLGHALAKQYEDLGDYPTSFDWLVRAKSSRRATLRTDIDRDRALFSAAAATAPVTARIREAGTAADNPSEEPIFIIGLPRTGTTLVDRILGSHPGVFSAGELPNFATLIKKAARTPSNLVLDPATLNVVKDLDIHHLGRIYIDSTRPRTGSTPRFTDKMPLNFFYAGLIARALPNARIICLRREAMDTCLSNFRQLFATGFSYYNYAYDLEDTGRYYLLFDELVTHWREQLPPDRFTEVHYEQLVADQEAQSRRLVEFCGLDWDPACLEFHRNEAPVATASSVQVRSPIYTTSIGRWKRYGNRVDGLARILGVTRT